MADHTILFTITTRAVAVEPDVLPISVFVSPRLTGGELLGEFPDWVAWAYNLKENGLDLEIATEGRSTIASVDTRVLRPDLWQELFNRDTLVEPHTFDDYSGKPIVTYSVRDCLSVLKAIYQEASVSLALPDPPPDRRDEREPEPEPGQEEERPQIDREGGNRRRLSDLVTGLAVHWDGRLAPRMRAMARVPGQMSHARSRGQQTLDHEGLTVFGAGGLPPDICHDAALPFSVFSHMPSPPERDELKIDGAKLFDFHTALSTLSSYPRLLRALGIVFDIDLPLDFIDVKPSPALSHLWVDGVTIPSGEWSTPPTVRSLRTAVLHTTLPTPGEGSRRYFFTAPRWLADPSVPLVFGLLGLEPAHFGLAQLDVDGGMHKAIMVAESLNPPPGHNLVPDARPQEAPNPEVFDPGATLPALRSGGLSLYGDRAALALLAAIKQSKIFNDAVTGAGPAAAMYADDLVRGYRLDVWDSLSDGWHSLHLRTAKYRVGDVELDRRPQVEEGFVELAVTRPAPGAKPATNDLYLHEALARWRGWSLSAPLPFRHLTRYPDAADALPDPKPGDPPDKYDENQPATPFRVTSPYDVVRGSLPVMRFGVRYRMRARVVDIAGNSLDVDDRFGDLVSRFMALPQDPEGFAYLRYEPVAAPLVVIRDTSVVTEPGSAVHRLVLRTYNTSPDGDTDAADASLGDRHIVPPRTSVEMGERLGMFDEPFGKLKPDAATWDLIATRDAADFDKEVIAVAGGEPKEYPVQPASSFDLPYLPDGLSVGAAIRDLPGTGSGVVGRAEPGAGPAASVAYRALDDPNPRPGSATIVGFGGPAWEQRAGFRLSLADPAPGQADLSPRWDPADRVLTVYLPKATTATVPLTSYVDPRDLKLLGVWQWLREYVESIVDEPERERLRLGADRIDHILQRAVEGGHWMLTPPTLLTLVHAVQQPIGRPAFTAVNVDPLDDDSPPDGLRTAPVRGVVDPGELAPITAWRRPGSTETYLVGGLKVHGASTSRIDLKAEWDDPVDRPPLTDGDPPTVPGTERHTGTADALLLDSLENGYLLAPGKKSRRVGYYDPEHDQIAFVRLDDRSRPPQRQPMTFLKAAPRHEIGDTRRHVVRYTATATSRYQEHFPQTDGLDFTRSGDAVVVDVPASARPLAPDPVYVVPTFGWQRQSDTNVKRSVRFGGGLRVYLRRPWYSSGAGELLGVALFDMYGANVLNEATRTRLKPYITQWGMDPIWDTARLDGVPGVDWFPDAIESDRKVTLDENGARDPDGKSGVVDVVGFEPVFDPVRGLWFADMTIDVPSSTYMPFVRLALVRYQPHALPDARISRVALADFVQLTPGRTATVTADPHHPRTLRVAVSGVAPRGPAATVVAPQRPDTLAPRPTQVSLRVQRRDLSLQSDLAWEDVGAAVAEVTETHDGMADGRPDLGLWTGTVTFATRPAAGEFRLLVEEREFVSARHVVIEDGRAQQPSRLIYAETFAVDEVLVGS